MQAILHPREPSLNSFGQRRGFSDLARFSLDLPWPRADSEVPAPGPLGDYPSPPMSGSSPIQPKVINNQEAEDRVHQVYQPATGHDVYRASAATTQQPDSRMLPGLAAPLRPYQAESLERMSYAYQRPEDHIQRSMSSYMPQHSQMLSQQQHSYLPAPAPIPTSVPSQGYNTVTSRPPTRDSQQSFTSPKSQRKTKGHVASACVPCKKAHLRCDAQRPCTRCVQNGKEDACVDVQHKKRGRPRLRDDHRGAGFDPRLGHSQDSFRRPLSYQPQNALAYGDDPLRRPGSYRVLKSQPPEPLGARMLERGAMGGANIFPAPLSIPARPAEPAAFLTMDMEIAKASSTFLDTIGRLSVQGLRITDVLALEDRDRVAALQRQIQTEQARREPNYLPPMYVKQEEEKVFRALGFSREELAPYSLDMMENLHFTDQSGQIRSVQARVGLAKYGSIFFVVVVLSTGFRPFPTPSPQSRDPRDMGYTYPAQQLPYGQSTPVSATFDPGRGRSASDVSYLSRQSSGQMMPGMSPRMSSSYAPSPGRPDYASGQSAYIPRSELSSAPRPVQPAGYQLPPIRSQQQQQQQQQQPQYQQLAQAQQQQHAQYPASMQHPGMLHADQGWARDDRQQRVDIGGLIDRPDASQQRNHG